MVGMDPHSASTSGHEDKAAHDLSALGFPASWLDPLASRYDLQRLFRDINQLYRDATEPIYPDQSQIFRAFQLTSLENVRVVILGQDPYTRPGEADGLAFSMPKRGARLPRSLRAIYANLANDPDLANAGQTLDPPDHGDLTVWAGRGVLLLNTALTVGSKAGSHKQLWRGFAPAILDLISEKTEPVAFLLWGAPSIRAARAIRSTDDSRHQFSCSAHPVAWVPGSLKPFAAVRHFSAANERLDDRAVDWSLPPV